jgi:hypothetical protein
VPGRLVFRNTPSLPTFAETPLRPMVMLTPDFDRFSLTPLNRLMLLRKRTVIPPRFEIYTSILTDCGKNYKENRASGIDFHAILI